MSKPKLKEHFERLQESVGKDRALTNFLVEGAARPASSGSLAVFLMKNLARKLGQALAVLCVAGLLCFLLAACCQELAGVHPGPGQPSRKTAVPSSGDRSGVPERIVLPPEGNDADLETIRPDVPPVLQTLNAFMVLMIVFRALIPCIFWLLALWVLASVVCLPVPEELLTWQKEKTA